MVLGLHPCLSPQGHKSCRAIAAPVLKVTPLPGWCAQVVSGLQPGALPPLRARYCAALNRLLRQELRAVTAAGRKAAASADPAVAAGGGRATPNTHYAPPGPGAPLVVFRQGTPFPRLKYSFHSLKYLHYHHLHCHLQENKTARHFDLDERVWPPL